MQHVSTIYARFITRELQLNASEIDKLLQNTSLNAEQLFERSTMPYLEFFDFLIRVKEQFKDDELGLKVGKNLSPMSLGELGNAIIVAPNVLESFTLASTFAHLHAAYMDTKLTATFDSVSMDFIEQADLGVTQQFQTEVLLLLVQNIIEALTGKPFTDGNFFFPYEAPENQKYYAHYFHSQMIFGEEHARIEIPRHYLTIQSPFYNPVAWKGYQLKFVSQLNELVKKNDKPFTNHVNDFLRSYPPPLPSVGDTANSLNMTERTLNRRLGNEGSSYRDMRNSVLQHHAEFYLNDTDLTIDAIACQLGYKDFSSFRRAFKKWTRCSPKAYREK